MLTNALLILNGRTNKDELTWDFFQKWLNPRLEGMIPHNVFAEFLFLDWKKISPEALDLLEPILNSPNFNKEAMMKISEAAGSLCFLVVRFVNLHKVWKHIQTYWPDDGSALIADAAPDPQLEGGNL